MSVPWVIYDGPARHIADEPEWTDDRIRQTRAAMIPRAQTRLALLECMEFFREELSFGVDSPRLEKKYTELRGVCYQALGEPSMADIDRIREEARSS
jgi:hypothetical protein